MTHAEQRVLAQIRCATDELFAEHRPQWISRDDPPGFTETDVEGRDPIGCVVCYPADGSCPCTSRIIADATLAMLDGLR